MSPNTFPDMPDQEFHMSKVGAEIEKLNSLLQHARQEIGRVIFGQAEVIDLAMVTLLAGGHALLIGVPGLDRTSTRLNSSHRR